MLEAVKLMKHADIEHFAMFRLLSWRQVVLPRIVDEYETIACRHHSLGDQTK